MSTATQNESGDFKEYESGDFKEPPKLNQSIKLLTPGEIELTCYSWESDEIQSQLPTDVLLLTANDHEFNACYSYMREIKKSSCNKLGTVYFGVFAKDDNQNVKVALLKSRQGPTEAVITVKNAAEILFPKVVVSVGICATLKPEKAKLGDVLISAKLATYADVKRMPEDKVENRGIKTPVSRYMKSLIPTAHHGWEPPLENLNSLNVKVHPDAVMLSGPELVNNLERRQQLLSDCPEALGLEMEGAGNIFKTTTKCKFNKFPLRFKMRVAV